MSPIGVGDGKLVNILDLSVHFPVESGLLRRRVGTIRAVDGVSLGIEKGESVGLVGESGCGKTTFGRAVLRLIEPTSGSVTIDGVDILSLKTRELRAARREMQIVFQDPYSSLNPRMSVKDLIAEPVRFHKVMKSETDIDEWVDELLGKVGLSPSDRGRYPHEFSGGQRQRIAIARGLSIKPRLLVLDEPVSALDVSVQAQVLNLLIDLRSEFGFADLFISHDLSVVRQVCATVAVMYLGRIVEFAPTELLYNLPQHPYTEGLLAAVPVPDPSISRDRIILQGDVPSPSNPPTGCNFHTRCPYAIDICSVEEPVLQWVGDAGEGTRLVACHRAEELHLNGLGVSA